MRRVATADDGSTRHHVLTPIPLLLALAALQSNDAPLNNGGDVVLTYSSPSVGAPLGHPPDLAGDLWWKVLPGDRFMGYQGPSGATMEIDGYFESYHDTDWTTPGWFHERMHGPSLRSANPLTPGNLEPAFFQLGLTTETHVSLGPSGFGNPCTIAPSLCSPGGCMYPGFVTGYLVDLSLDSTAGSGVVVPSDGSAVSDLVTTYFVPGGMSIVGGSCGSGDLVSQSVASIDETMADDLGGYSPYGGFQLGGQGPVADAVNVTSECAVTFREPILNVIATTNGLVYPFTETGNNGGGATNGLKLSVGSGTAFLGVEVRSLAAAAVPNFAFGASAFNGLAPPGIPVLGAAMLIVPDLATDVSLQNWQGSVSPSVFTFTSEGAFQSVQFPIPATAAGLDLFTQGILIDAATLKLRTTNAVRTSLL